MLYMPESKSGTSVTEQIASTTRHTEWKWKLIAKNFVVRLPKAKSNHDAIWVIIDQLTKSTRFLHISERFSLENFS